LNVYNIEIKDQFFQLNTEDSIIVKKLNKNNQNIKNVKNMTEEKKNNFKNDFIRNFLDQEKFDYDKHLPNYSKNKNSSVKDMFVTKNLNFLKDEVNF